MTSSIHYMVRQELQALINYLQDAGYRCAGPQVRDGAIVYDALDDISDLPQGILDQQEPGQYRLRESDSARYFSWANGPQAIKPYVFSAKESLWRSELDQEGRPSYVDLAPEPIMQAIIGVRACDIAALFIQDRHFLQEQNKDPYYLARRQNLFLVAVNCTHPADTCFCVSTGDGPRASFGYDIQLSELDDGFLVHGLSDKGIKVINQLSTVPASHDQIQQVQNEIASAEQKQKRCLTSENLSDSLFANLDHPQWEEIARRCLSCGNCTAVCPTCFCHAEDDDPALDGSSSEYYRQWDSCFTQGHSYIHGITIRATTAQRYRQWLTHKFGSWHDQYGRSGCVGCGRCITWCPVGIDVTEEIENICGKTTNG